MRKRQPDNRIHFENLGMVTLGGKRFVVNLGPGVPFNACIENFKGSLRCWASHRWLDSRAADLVDHFATETDGNAYIWRDEVIQGPVACIKGDRALYTVTFP